ncbi:flippase-like domain-containing protein [Thermoleophilia bacterium SCSIO 60948]|nr:flippase-like domain-containing protein [Thermoleophilia bacterium SCSIO 60948]
MAHPRRDPTAASNGFVATDGKESRPPATVADTGEPDTEEQDQPAFFEDPRKLVQTLIAVVVLVIAIYFVIPRVAGLDGAIEQIWTGDHVWLAVAVAFNFLAFGSYVALFRGVVGERVVHLEWRESYQITMAGLAATRLFSAGGAGGIILTYWALRKAGVERREAASRMVAFNVLLYAFYMLALVLAGTLLYTGVAAGNNPLGLTLIPAAAAAGVIVLFLLIALIPSDFERRMRSRRYRGRVRAFLDKLITAPATLADGTRMAIAFVRRPSRGGLALTGAVGFWAANVGILWASFHAFDVAVPLAVVVQGFFIGMLANLFPFAPGGVGAVDAGMIGTFVLFGLPENEVFAAVLAYRIVAFWMPIPPGIVAFFGLRKTVARWTEERRAARASATPESGAVRPTS